jgi:DNA-binding response OmpR family regulator
METVVLIENDGRQSEAVGRYLSLVGMTVCRVQYPHDLDRIPPMAAGGFVVIRLDAITGDALSLFTRLRAAAVAGLVVLLPAGNVDDKVLALRMGADICLADPVHFRELEAVLRSLSRRLDERAVPSVSRQAHTDDRSGCWGLDSRAWALVTPRGRQVPLSRAEYQLMQSLVTQPGVPVGRHVIGAALGNAERACDGRGIDAIVTRLRRKVASLVGETLPLRSARCYGYVFAAPIDHLDAVARERGAACG